MLRDRRDRGARAGDEDGAEVEHAPPEALLDPQRLDLVEVDLDGVALDEAELGDHALVGDGDLGGAHAGSTPSTRKYEPHDDRPAAPRRAGCSGRTATTRDARAVDDRSRPSMSESSMYDMSAPEVRGRDEGSDERLRERAHPRRRSARAPGCRGRARPARGRPSITGTTTSLFDAVSQAIWPGNSCTSGPRSCGDPAPPCRTRPCRWRCARTRACPGRDRAPARRPSSSRSPPS